ncbi:hypothetical protein ONZ45_g14764 [Pleurotus djamor]|nr:hypothetical protein ONZ45_g14764 [Pleurotus djamor]
MPTKTEREWLAEELLMIYFASVVAASESQINDAMDDSDDSDDSNTSSLSSSLSSSSSSSDSSTSLPSDDEESGFEVSDAILETLRSLYADR